MKKIAKILALVLSLVMAVTCFSACSDKKNDQEKTSKATTEESDKKEIAENSEEEEVEVVVENFFQTFQSGDIEALVGYFKEDSEAYNKMMSYLQLDKFSEMTASMEELGISEDEVNVMLEYIFSALFGDLEYEIIDINVDGNEAAVNYKISLPDYSKIDENSIDMNSILVDALEDAGYSLIELSAMTEEEIRVIAPEVMGTFIEAMVGALTDAVKDVEPLEQECTLGLEKVDGKWLIVSGIFGLLS